MSSYELRSRMSSSGVALALGSLVFALGACAHGHVANASSPSATSSPSSPSSPPSPSPAPPAIALAPPKDPFAAVHFIGRFDRSDPEGPRFAWPGSEIVARFRGSGIDVTLASTGASQSQLDVLV